MVQGIDFSGIRGCKSYFIGGTEFLSRLCACATGQKKGGIPQVEMRDDDRLGTLVKGKVYPSGDVSHKGVYIFFAGVNASGKSTMIKALKSFEEYSSYYYVCADEVEKKLGAISDKTEKMLKARDYALTYREILLNSGENVVFESVASHPSHLEDLQRIKARGNKVVTVYVGTSDPSINIARIKKRGRENDTFLNDDRVIRRRENSLKLLKDFLEISDEAVVFDNSEAYRPVYYRSADGREFADKGSWLIGYIK